MTAQSLQGSLLETPLHGPRAEQGTGIEQRFDVPFVARLALKEKQIQQNVRPVIAVHKWFARRPGSLFRALLLAEFADDPLRQSYYYAHDFAGLRVADPFMGGGTPLLEANRLGCDVLGWDVNPMAYWIVQQEILRLDLEEYLAEAGRIEAALDVELGHLYRTHCQECGSPEAAVKYFIWVKTQLCRRCGDRFDLFPGFLLAADERHPRNVVICSLCGDLNEVEDRDDPGTCGCGGHLTTNGPARRGRCQCPSCGEENRYPQTEEGPPQHRMAALEYHCPQCKPGHQGRFFKKPDAADLDCFAEAERRFETAPDHLVPDDPIAIGDETRRLHRWGYLRYRDMFNPRQLLGLSLLAARISAVEDRRIRSALATNLSDLLRYQNMLCRYDRRALKSLDIFSVHGFPVGLIQCESNFLGIRGPRGGTNVGSGGWSNVVEKFTRARRFCDSPFEIRYGTRRKQQVSIVGEWIGDRRSDGGASCRLVELRCGSATEAALAPASLDAVLTDPPYFANVQYAELMDFCYSWLRRLVAADDPAFSASTTRREGDLTGNATLDRGLEHFTEGLSAVYRRLAAALKPGRPFAFTYHHNSLDAYYPVAVALLDAGLVCTASLPCPAEMGGSIHIHNSQSSIVDTVFVCRSTGTVPRRLLVSSPSDVSALVEEDLAQLAAAGVRVTRGDARCVTYGHLIRLAVWRLRDDWANSSSWKKKLEVVRVSMSELPSWETVQALLDESWNLVARRADLVRETTPQPYVPGEFAITF